MSNRAQSDLPARIAMHEGSVDLPAGFEDRSANLFVPRDPQNQPNLSVARDWLRAGETLEAYVERQLGILKARLPGHRLLHRDDERLGAHEPALVGVGIAVRYKNGAQIVHQRQAAFEIGNGRILVFTAATPREMDAGFDVLWRTWLDSFRPAIAAAE